MIQCHEYHVCYTVSRMLSQYHECYTFSCFSFEGCSHVFVLWTGVLNVGCLYCVQVNLQCRLRKLNDGALTQLAIDLSVIKDALARFPADAFAAARPSMPYPVSPSWCYVQFPNFVYGCVRMTDTEGNVSFVWSLFFYGNMKVHDVYVTQVIPGHDPDS